MLVVAVSAFAAVELPSAAGVVFYSRPSAAGTFLPAGPVAPFSPLSFFFNLQLCAGSASQARLVYAFEY